MRRLVLLPMLALTLVSGCGAPPSPTSKNADGAAGGATENTVATVDDTVNDAGIENGSTGTPTAGEDAYCPAVDYATSAAQCRRFTEEKATLEAGLGVFNAPSEMVVGESRDLVLGVGKKADAAEVHESVGGNATQHVEVRTPIGHLMTATLSGGGFDITPAGPQPKTLAADRSEVWQWRITAKEAGPQKLLLTISVDATAADGSRSRYDLARKPIDINVAVTDAQRRDARAKALEDKLRRGTGVMGALEKWLIALAAVVVALGGVWIAVRTFGKGKDKGDAAKKDDAGGGPVKKV
ncbi:hypothetical protein IAG41_03925 [Sphingomonas sp. JC676]|uniref:hypothetical protein n=1 Tax=Sphingomonas sp. JC676 TaxID=2768065 RepID=UPI001657C1EF|nr:hypothetical protein [Sphingomonas sp. JC676]MBC9031532.1 hypothetical protein [Sphingomonas sp. JC676]